MLDNRCTRRRPARVIAIACLAGFLALPSFAHAAEPASETAGDSPREAVWEFLDRVHRRDLAGAAAYLALPGGSRGKGPVFAERLGSVLDHSAALDIDSLSTEPEGNRDDGLGARLEEVARVTRRDGSAEPVRMERTGDRWRFTASTVARVDAWHTELQPGRLAAWMPPFLRATGPYGVAWWQWIGVISIIVVALGLGRLLGGLTSGVASRVARHTSFLLDDDIIRSMSGPMTAFWSLLLMRLAMPLLELHPQASVVVTEAIAVAMFGVFFWALTRGVDVLCALALRSGWAQSPSSRSLIRLARRVVKVVIVVIGAVSVLSSLGYPVASLIAGLGVGGVAMALAAQKTVENLFGAFSIGVDQPIREGDFVNVEGLAGTVEAIGLRSTRLRTLDRTLVTIPNGKLADMRLETFAVRDRLRLATTLMLLYSTSTEQLARITDALRAELRGHPKIWPDSINVYVSDLTESAVKLEIAVWFQTADWDEFQQIRHDLLLRFVDIVHEAGTDFASPPRGPEVTASLAEMVTGRDGGERSRTVRQPS
jgi:MscS family membrane protein